MKAIAWLVSALMLAALAAPADAKTQPRKHKRHVAAYAKPEKARKPVVDTSSDWYERDVNKLPFGTSVWWDQMLRENRLTCCN